MRRREVTRDLLCCVFLIAAFFYATLTDVLATPCVVSFENDATVDYFELELNGELHRIEAADSMLKADLNELMDGVYDASICAVNEYGRSAPVYFTLFKQSDKNKSYYSITPEEGYEQFFIGPLVMVINTKAGKAVGGSF